MTHQWQQITDLGNSFSENAYEELHYLADIWREQKNQFDSNQVNKFITELKREWSIETGLIEGIYELDRGVTETLIKHGIREDRIPTRKNDSSIRVAAILHDHEHVIDGLFDFVKGNRKLSVGYIKELHNALLQNQDTTKGVDQFGKSREIPLLRGKFKKHSNNPRTKDGEIHQYCPPEHVESEMDNLISMHDRHVKNNYPPLATAAWLHHRFTQIHPFQDGNGRVARCLATLIFIKAEWFPLVIRKEEERESYIDALVAADADNLSPLINLFATVQKRYFLNALPESAIIKSATQKLKIRKDKLTGGYEPSEIIANKLTHIAHRRLQDTCSQINKKFAPTDNAYVHWAENHDSSARQLWVSPQNEAAKHYKHHPNIPAYCSWVYVHIPFEPPTNILILFHGVGPEYHGVIACSACYYNQKQNTLEFLSDEVFQINYKEPLKEAQQRFEEWLDRVIPAGLRLWYDSL